MDGEYRPADRTTVSDTLLAMLIGNLLLLIGPYPSTIFQNWGKFLVLA